MHHTAAIHCERPRMGLAISFRLIDWIATSAMRFRVSSSNMSSWISVSASDRTSEASSLASSWSFPSLICLTLR